MGFLPPFVITVFPSDFPFFFRISITWVGYQDLFLPAIAEENLWVLVRFRSTQIKLSFKTFVWFYFVFMHVFFTFPVICTGHIKKRAHWKTSQHIIGNRNKLWKTLKRAFSRNSLSHMINMLDLKGASKIIMNHFIYPKLFHMTQNCQQNTETPIENGWYLAGLWIQLFLASWWHLEYASS